MPHNLSENPQTGQVSMMFYGDTPWHGLGMKLDQPATSVEAIRAAGLDWEVVKKPLYIQVGQAYEKVKDKYVMMRADQQENIAQFGVVSGDYRPLQNLEAFDFFDAIVYQGAAIYHTAGALGEGERVWILAKLPETIRVVGDDICDKYLLLSNSHDGKSSVQMKFTPIRVVCQNTLTMALSQGPTIRVSHTKNVQERMRQSKRLLGIIDHRYKEIELAFTSMANVKMDVERLLDYYTIVFPDPKDLSDEQAARRAAQNRKIAKRFYLEGSGNQEKGVAGTLWAAYNGVTEMVDYHRQPSSSEKWLSNIWFGDGYLVKARAFAVAVNQMQKWNNL